MKIDGKQITSLVVPETTEFRHSGCENCANGLGTEVYKVEAHYGMKALDYFEVMLCHSCVCAWYNADPLDCDCLDAFNI